MGQWTRTEKTKKPRVSSSLNRTSPLLLSCSKNTWFPPPHPPHKQRLLHLPSSSWSSSSSPLPNDDENGVYDPLNASNLLYVYPINGKLVAYSSSLAACAACARCAADVSCWSISSMGKYCVSMLLCSLGSNGARIRRRPSQATPLKKGCCLISLAPPMRPRRCSASHIRL
jgi:hypothetical protein